MKKIQVIVVFSILAFTLGSQRASAQSVVYDETWATVDGWGVIEPNWTSVSTGSGWTLAAAGAPDYGAAVGSTASAALTTDLANAQSITLNVSTTPASFGYYLQFDFTVNNSVLGYISWDNYSFPNSASIGGTASLTWGLSPALQSELAANPGSTTSVNFQVGGGGPGQMTLNSLVITDAAVPEPTSMALMGAGAVGLLKFARRRKF